MRFHTAAFMAVAVCVAVGPVYAGPASGVVHYVDDSAGGANDGTSWADAFVDLQSALGTAQAGDWIWVAAGTYRPSVPTNAADPRTATFRLIDEVEVYGGFAGNEDPGAFDLADRDFAVNETVLSGDIGAPVYDADNAYHVCYHATTGSLENTPVLDGFTLTGGNADGGTHSGGGAVYGYNSRLVLANCVIRENAARYGGGLRFDESRPTLTNCLLTANTAEQAGAIYCSSSDATMVNCTLAGNDAFTGGGLYCSSSNPVVTNCILWHNRAAIGHQVYHQDSSPTFSHCDITESGGSGNWDTALGTDGGNNIDADPMFAFSTDHHLMAGSPCIDTGTNAPAGGLPSSDVEGNRRPLDGDGDADEAADMGAYEYNSAAPPAIAIGALPAEFVVAEGEPAPAAQVLSVRNSGGGTLDWAATVSRPWLQVQPSGGVSSGEVNQIVLTPDVIGLTPQGRTNLLTLSDPQAVNSPRAVPIDLEVYRALRVPSEYPTIQAAIDAAVYGDVVVVADGVYAGEDNTSLDPGGKTITVRSENGPERCIIDCEGDAIGFWLGSDDGPDLRIEGFSIVNGAHINLGGGILVWRGSATIVNCIFRGCWAPSGGAVAVFEGNAVLIDCDFIGNSARMGGAIHCETGQVTLRHCRMSGNKAYVAGGAGYFIDSDLSLTGCTVTGNSAGVHGDGLSLKSGDATMINSIVWGNAGVTGREIENDGSSLLMIHCDVAGSGGSGNWDASFGTDGGGNIDADPQFAFDGDGHLMPGSPCIDAGTNGLVFDRTSTDIEGGARRLDGDGDGYAKADIGAYEANGEAPTIALSHDAIELRVNEGTTDPVIETLSIRNSGAGPLLWQLAEDCSWLDVQPASGESTGEADDVTLTVDASGLARGVYRCRLTVSDGQAANSPRVLPVRLQVYRTLRVPSEYARIADAVDYAVDGDVVLLADGVYRGPGNKDIEFHGKEITVRSENGPENCVIDCDRFGQGFCLQSFEGPAARVEGLTITNGVDRKGNDAGGIELSNSSATIANCRIIGNRGFWGGGVVCTGGSPMFVDCTIIQNTTAYSGGGVFCSKGSPLLLNCTIAENESHIRGGGIGGQYQFSLGDCDYTIISCRIVRNKARSTGGGAYFSCASKLLNCTISENSAGEQGGGVYTGSYPTSLANCIVWGNSSPDHIDFYSHRDIPVFTHCNVAGSGGSAHWRASLGMDRGGNIDVDPLFAMAGDYHLMPGSPCIDAGTNVVSSQLMPTDIEGNDRLLDGDGDMAAILDMGAYEFVPMTPSLAISAEMVKLFTSQGATSPVEHVLYVRNSGVGAMNWQITESCSWLDVQPPTGDSTGEVDQVVITVDPAGLVNGIHDCVLEIMAPQASNAPRRVTMSLYVNSTLSVPSQYSNIQSAIDDAIDGDLVLVAAGTYTGIGNRDIDLRGKRLRLYGENGPEHCIIDCERGGRGFHFRSIEGPDTHVRGFTIKRGRVGADQYGGGIFCDESSPTISDCRIVGNTAYDGGGVSCDWSQATWVNCSIVGNTADNDGGGIHFRFSDCVLLNCTISGNETVEDGGGLYNRGVPTAAQNCIFWGNAANNGSEVYYRNLATTFFYSNVGGSGGSEEWDDLAGADGGGNIDADPQFVRAPSPGPDGAWGTLDDDYGDLRLQSGSPCVERGDTGLLPADVFDLDGDGDTAEHVPFDIAGAPRVQGRSVDMGAYESGYLVLDTDFNDDEYVDDNDAATFRACMSGAEVEFAPGCEPTDLDFDGDVDQSDYGIFQGCLSGSYMLPDPACVD